MTPIASSILRSLILSSMRARSASASFGFSLNRSSIARSTSSVDSLSVEDSTVAGGGVSVAAMTEPWWKRMKKKAVAAMTMQVVSTTGEKRGVRAWKGFGREEVFLGL